MAVVLEVVMAVAFEVVVSGALKGVVVATPYYRNSREMLSFQIVTMGYRIPTWCLP